MEPHIAFDFNIPEKVGDVYLIRFKVKNERASDPPGTNEPSIDVLDNICTHYALLLDFSGSCVVTNDFRDGQNVLDGYLLHLHVGDVATKVSCVEYKYIHFEFFGNIEFVEWVGKIDRLGCKSPEKWSRSFGNSYIMDEAIEFGHGQIWSAEVNCQRFCAKVLDLLSIQYDDALFPVTRLNDLAVDVVIETRSVCKRMKNQC